MNEKSWERTDKGGSSTGSFDLRGRVSPFFVFFSLSSCYCISSLFFIEEEVNEFSPFFLGLQKTSDT